ncbi:MAG: Nif3-like dinuclear metal center hexameric protein [Planctomycetaceae bacterium]|nr:Nif3-like dinuclear metal center hexameric protein [Planctomycetaceae bacterium]
MTSVADITDFLEEFAPRRLAEDWDNVGLLVGDSSQNVQRVMTCLTVTPGSAEEAIGERADLIVSHHPMPFRPLKRLTTESVPGRLLWQLIRAGVSIHSPHTCFDSAAMGINQRLAEGLGLENIKSLVEAEDDPDGLGSGRYGSLGKACSLAEVSDALKQFLKIEGLHAVGEEDTSINRVAVACGSAGSFLGAARRAGCQLLVTGETTFHTCLEGEATNISLLLPGHYASERFAVETLADVLGEQFSDIEVWASRDEADPVRWV